MLMVYCNPYGEVGMPCAYLTLKNRTLTDVIAAGIRKAVVLLKTVDPVVSDSDYTINFGFDSRQRQ